MRLNPDLKDGVCARQAPAGRPSRVRLRSARGAACLLGLLLLGPMLLGQNSRFGVIRNFKLPEYYKPEELPAGARSRFKSLLLAGEVRPSLDRTADVTDMRLFTCDPDGTTNLAAIAASCRVDLDRRIAWSPDRLEVRSGDGRLYIEGHGFYCNMTNATVIISNRVRTFIQKDLVNLDLRKP